MSKSKVALLILDGFGIGNPNDGNAIYLQGTPNFDALKAEFPNSMLNASGRFVGLPEGQMGNSEVGHTNIGAGRVVWQDLTRISDQIEDGSFYDNPVLVKAYQNIMKKQRRARKAARKPALHLMGLLSDGGVHSHNSHLYALLKMAKDYGLTNVYIHCILDGRDVPPSCCEKYINELEQKCKEIGVGKIATVCGRYYAMDRDKRYDRLKLAYELYTKGEGRKGRSVYDLLVLARHNNETDEFVKPGIVDEAGDNLVLDGDSLIFFNFRPDRAREITRAFVDDKFEGFERRKLEKLDYICFTNYDATIENVKVAFPKAAIKNTLGEYAARKGLKQLRIAETEKYAHVTFFLNGGIEKQFRKENRILVPSPKVETYDQKPEMSVYEVSDKLLESIGKYRLTICNFANCDMVGHTGDLAATKLAVKAVDECLGKVYQKCKEKGVTLLITADHGNAELMLDEYDHVVTSHSTNPVPFVLCDKRVKGVSDGSLCDIAPTVLTLLKLPIPKEMEGKSLIQC